ncbi:MAG: CDP-alcohol phosphatidyltransferase family protein, partial [Acidobacteria bacterium]|nr:CDP-alcohol phosphatidyltransferase family protein [Acidobacteriota bacterium]
NEAADWQKIDGELASRFLWLPWNFVPDSKALGRLIEAGKTSTEGARFAVSDGQYREGRQEAVSLPSTPTDLPAVIIKKHLKVQGASVDRRTGSCATVSLYPADAPSHGVPAPQHPGVVVRPGHSVGEAERELVRRTGKDTDGIYSTLNRSLCRPAVRWLSKTPVTPNMISFAGLAVAMLSGYWFAQGYWAAYVLGALLYFVSVLFDEADGMLARLTFRESAFGCWLDSFVDYASYVVIFTGMTIGLYREGGPRWLLFGGLLLFGTLASFLVFVRQRRLATNPKRPHEYLGRIQRRLEADSGNLLSRLARLTEFVIRKSAFGYWVLVFSALGGLKVFFLMAAFGSNLVWPLALSFNRLFGGPSPVIPAGGTCDEIHCTPALGAR